MPPHAKSDWDPLDSSILGNQRRAYDEMRETCPVAHSDFLGWSLFRHRDVAGATADSMTFSNVSKHRAVPNGMDPPEHTRYRQAINPFFVPARMTAFEPETRRLAGRLVESMLARTTFDFVSDFSGPFCSRSLCDFLGWPEDTWVPILEWTHGNQEAALSRDREAGAALARELADIVLEQVNARRDAGRSVASDLTTSLMEIEVDGRALSNEELVSVLRNWIAGHGTVAAALEILMFHIASDQKLQAKLRSDPTLVPAAVDEIMRLDGPLVANARTTTSDVLIGGRNIPAGDRVTLIWIAANRDPHVFDDPDRIHLDRDQSQNLVFGAGIHDCVGASLARLELKVALEEILSRTASIERSGATPKRALYPSNGFVDLGLRFC